MTAPRPPVARTATATCAYSQLAVGDEMWDALTVTETHVILAAAAFNDPGPNHLNALQAAGNRFGARIAHGPMLMGIMDGALGNVLGSTIVALLEHRAEFKHPAGIGDTVIAHWRVSALAPKPAKFDGGGVVTFEGEALNQDGRVLAVMTAVLAVADSPLWSAADHIAAAAKALHPEATSDHGA
jgi:3-hydroxybutyryl-CoA dehydratase